MVLHYGMVSFRSQVARKLLNYFFLNQGARAYTNQLARLLDVDPKNLDRKLKEFEREGLLQSEFSGKQRYFSLNPRFPLLREYRKVFLKTQGIEARLKTVLNKLPGLKAAYLFGSYAKDNLDASSDLDLLLVGEHSPLAAQKIVLPVQREIQREINIVDMTEKEFQLKKRTGNVFVKHIFSQPLVKLL